MNFKGLRLTTALAVPVFVAAMASGAVARDMVVIGPGGGYQDAARTTLFQPFAKEHGLTITDDASDGGTGKIYSMIEAGDVTQDVVMVGASELLRGCEDGIFEPIDYTVVDKAKFVAGTALECGVGGAGWGAAVFYDKSKHAEGPQTYADFFDLKKFPGKRSLPGTAQMSLEASLLADGVPSDKVYDVLGTPEGQDRAFQKLDTIKSSVIWWKSGAQPLQFVGSGEADYALGFTGRILRAISQDKKDYALDWATLQYSVDYWAVVKGTPYKKESMEMIQYMTDPAPLRAQAAIWPISPANKEINQDPEIRKSNPGMVLNHVDEGLFINTQFWLTHGEALEARFSAWAAK